MVDLIKKLLSFRRKNNFFEKKIEFVLKEIPSDFGGGCSLEKALLMGYLIKEFTIQKSIDIGVYKGRSFFPQAFAHKCFTNGIVYGIDPLTGEDAVQKDREDLKFQLDNFVNSTDFDGIYRFLLNKINDYDLTNNCNLIRQRSDLAFKGFEKSSIGLIHIDGNHDTREVLSDVENYFTLLSEQSFVVLDDISWDSVKPAYEILNSRMDFIGKLVDKSNDFALFISKNNPEEKFRAQEIFSKIR